MTESLSHKQTREERKVEAIKSGLALGEVLSREPEPLVFPGIPQEILDRLLVEDEEYPNLSTPTLTIIARMKSEGMRVSFGDHPDSGNVFVVSSQSKDVENDGLFPRHLQIVPGMPKGLRDLIRWNRIGFALSNPGIQETKQSE